jgi:nucleotide-binding universal stress UspA family protein
MTVLVGYVPNALGEAALRAGVEEARMRKQPLVVLNMARDDVLVDARRAAADDLARVQRDVAELGVEVEVVQVEEGSDPAETIVAQAEARSAVGKLLMGSVAQRILLDARCPVLAVKAEA